MLYNEYNEIRESFILAMRAENIPAEVRSNVLTTVEDAVVNNLVFDDEEGEREHEIARKDAMTNSLLRELGEER